MRVDTISLTKGTKDRMPGVAEKLKAVPFFQETSGEYYELIGHRIIEGEYKGNYLTSSQYVIVANEVEVTFKLSDQVITAEVSALIDNWKSTEYGCSEEEDRYNFAEQLLEYFKSKL